mmetsp:Transcript_14006/g.9884  ORF Transcript_14006/g.9884 Transcript_14006/m.9884 type:complete len:98 (+) Transcript_14006:659-952(+)
MIDNREEGSEEKVAISDETGLPTSNIRFQLVHNDYTPTLFAVGSATQFPSFMHKQRVRTSDVKYNCEAAVFTAMQMLDKRNAIFRYIPMTNLRIGEH